MSEAVDHPSHYGGKDNPYEAIKVIKAWGLGFCLGSALKYIARTGKKDPAKEIEDLEKAAWYITSEIEDKKAAKGFSSGPVAPREEVKAGTMMALCQCGGATPAADFELKGEWIEIHPEGQEACIVFLPYDDIDPSFLNHESAMIRGKWVSSKIECPRCKREWPRASEQAESVSLKGECLVCFRRLPDAAISTK